MHTAEGFIRHIDSCSIYDSSLFVPFHVDSRQVGWVLRSLVPVLRGHSAFVDMGESLSLIPVGANDEAARSKAIAEAALLLAEHEQTPLDGEIYPILTTWGEAPLACIDRRAIPWFGTRGFGVHVNGYVRRPDGLYLWIGQRAPDRKVDPNKLDTMIGGGLPYGQTIRSNLEKEAWEEAGFSPMAVTGAQHVSTLNYKVEMMGGLRNDTLFVFDMELPDGKTPRSTDGEVASFKLWPAHEVAHIIHETDHFKFNCNLVLIDFLLRHNLIGLEAAEAKRVHHAMAPLLSDEGKEG